MRIVRFTIDTDTLRITPAGQLTDWSRFPVTLREKCLEDKLPRKDLGLAARHELVRDAKLVVNTRKLGFTRVETASP